MNWCAYANMPGGRQALYDSSAASTRMGLLVIRVAAA